MISLRRGFDSPWVHSSFLPCELPGRARQCEGHDNDTYFGGPNKHPTNAVSCKVTSPAGRVAAAAAAGMPMPVPALAPATTAVAALTMGPTRPCVLLVGPAPVPAVVVSTPPAVAVVTAAATLASVTIITVPVAAVVAPTLPRTRTRLPAPPAAGEDRGVAAVAAEGTLSGARWPAVGAPHTGAAGPRRCTSKALSHLSFHPDPPGPPALSAIMTTTLDKRENKLDFRMAAAVHVRTAVAKVAN